MPQYIKYLSRILLLSVFLTACSQNAVVVKKQPAINKEVIAKLSLQAGDSFLNQENDASELLQKYFTPWDQKKVSYSKTEAMWGLSYKSRKIYLENYRPATAEWFEKIIDNANFDYYNLQPQKAITLKNTDAKILPTMSPLFHNPLLPGEGFPFDYNQNSRLKINTPLMVSHLSKDRAWAYVESFSVGGWVSIDSIAFVDADFINSFKTSDYYISIKEKFALYDPVFRDYIKVATIFPKYGDNFLIAKRDDDLNAILVSTDIEESNISSFPFENSVQNRLLILNELLNEPYGWGGLLNNRDCSSFTQDYFMVFGKYLHRNSKAQVANGKYHDLSLLTSKEKKDFITENAIPFSTLIYLKGHIMLYIGVQENEPLVAHNIWSIRLKDKDNQEFRHIIGKATVTTLEPGIGLEGFNKESNLLERILGITIVE